MSRLVRIEKKCAVCGRVQSATMVQSGDAFGAPDLDGRPPMMMRALLSHSVGTCVDCHYSAADVSQRIPGFKRSMLERDEYIAVLEREDISSTAKSFLLASLLYSWCGAHRYAGMMLHKAAWVFDDHRQRDYAKAARRASLKHYDKIPTGNLTHEVIKVDIRRRSGDFDGAIASATELLERELHRDLALILRLEIALAEAHDDACHTTDEAARSE